MLLCSIYYHIMLFHNSFFSIGYKVLYICGFFFYRGGVGEQEEETAFRKWFRHIGELRSMFTTANLLALSATCTTTMRKRVMRELHMHKDLTTIISKSPNKPNIKFCVQKIDNTIDMSMVWLVDALEKLKIDFPRTIIYSNTIKQLSELYSYLCTENPDAVHLIDMFHSETPEEKKKNYNKQT